MRPLSPIGPAAASGPPPPAAGERRVVIVGGGAAGLTTAIFIRRHTATIPVVLLDGARRLGAKILVSGGGRCNVTNAVVTERDYWGGPSPIVRRVLRRFGAHDTVALFRDLGVALHEEEDGKLFPDSNRARDVLDALVAEATRGGVEIRCGQRVLDLARGDTAFHLTTAAGPLQATDVVLATGGRSLPKSGSDGSGYQLARALGHSIVDTTPALAPLVLAADVAPGEHGAFHAALSGVSLPAALSLWVDGRREVTLQGSLLWTHFGISGPLALNMSRHWLRARLHGRDAALTLSLLPARTFDDVERRWTNETRSRPRASVMTLLSSWVPASVAAQLLQRAGVEGAAPLSALTRDSRRRLSHALTSTPLPVVDSRGYSFAEATAGGVDLREIDPATMESRRCPRLYLVGEILDVDGRLGGFNFQWAWSTAAVAAAALARKSSEPQP